MTKKEYLLKVLSVLIPIWEPAEWLKALVEGWDIDDTLLDHLTEMLQSAIHKTADGIKKEELQKASLALQKLKQMEEQQLALDTEDLKSLDELIENL